MTNEEKQALTGLCKVEIKRWNAASEANPNMRYMVELMEIALATLTAQPVQLPYSWQVGDSPDSYFNDEVFTASDVRDALKEAGVSYTG